MITSVFVPTPCPCGRRHRLPAPPDGVIRWLCTVTRKVYTLRLQAAQFQRLLATTPSERILAAEGTCVLHRAAEPEGLQQRCEDCGWLIVSYRARVERLAVLPSEVVFWPTGSLVGRSLDGSWYLASLPPSPHRERVCYQGAA